MAGDDERRGDEGAPAKPRAFGAYRSAVGRYDDEGRLRRPESDDAPSPTPGPGEVARTRGAPPEAPAKQAKDEASKS